MQTLENGNKGFMDDEYFLNLEFEEKVNRKIDIFEGFYKENHKGYVVDGILESVKNINSLSIQEIKKEEKNGIIAEKIAYNNLYNLVYNVEKYFINDGEENDEIDLIRKYLPKTEDISKCFKFGKNIEGKKDEVYNKKINSESKKIFNYIKSNKKEIVGKIRTYKQFDNSIIVLNYEEDCKKIRKNEIYEENKKEIEKNKKLSISYFFKKY